MSELTADRLRELLNYNPETGVFTWRVAVGRRIKAGGRAGCVSKHLGYWLVRVDHTLYFAHRLAWLYVTGRWPDREIDHANRDRADNRIANLREATRSLNTANTRRPRDNTSGFKGVSWHKEAARWRGRIRVNNKQVHLGYFDTPEAAHAAYCVAAEKHFGEFARAA